MDKLIALSPGVTATVGDSVPHGPVVNPIPRITIQNGATVLYSISGLEDIKKLLELCHMALGEK